ncbi:ABC transporter permease [Allorhizobium borbori]|uniref:Spermidine/putrescine transport system permease protein n=1 Tax=Allorhizobium borbori TaxID=485907 RepID=A0A7W6P3X5_9HYPH|nr:ABC transporter permease [Allorhizobium borbori]MBB4105336.1 spermidine/putrescine transport system permease protein [Allorhizobium borbori]PZU25591.1 MAG: ABC transporter permease [Shinella sp.]
MARSRTGFWLSVPVYAAVVALCVAPLLILLAYSFFQVSFVAVLKEPTLKNYVRIVGSDTYRWLILKAFGSGLMVAAITAVIGYPVAWFIAKRVVAAKSAFLTLLLVPLYTGDLVRIFAWRMLLGAEGVLNTFLMAFGAIREPIGALLFSSLATHIVLTYNYLPFMVLGLWLAFEALDDRLVEAAADLGAGAVSTFRRVTLPLTVPGLVAGSMMVFVMVVGDYLTPQLVGGASGITIISAINDLFGTAFDWPLGSAIAWTMLAILALAFAGAAIVINRSSLGKALAAGEA